MYHYSLEETSSITLNEIPIYYFKAFRNLCRHFSFGLTQIADI